MVLNGSLELGNRLCHAVRVKIDFPLRQTQLGDEVIARDIANKPVMLVPFGIMDNKGGSPFYPILLHQIRWFVPETLTLHGYEIFFNEFLDLFI
jgi:hypothetical protein